MSQRKNSELLILGFPTKQGAKRFLVELLTLQELHLIRIEDAALAMKDEHGRIFGSSKTNLPVHGFVSGSLWGMLTGALFLEPFTGLILGSTIGLLTGSLLKHTSNENEISRTLVNKTAQRALEPRSSALFLLISKITPDKVMQRLYHHDATIIGSSLSIENERRLRAAWQMVRTEGPLSLHKLSQPHGYLQRGPETVLLPENTQTEPNRP